MHCKNGTIMIWKNHRRVKYIFLKNSRFVSAVETFLVQKCLMKHVPHTIYISGMFTDITSVSLNANCILKL